MSEHTKGPWAFNMGYSQSTHYGTKGASHPVFNVHSDFGPICRLWIRGTGKKMGNGHAKTTEDLERTEKDARLIAAAPALLEALVALLEDDLLLNEHHIAGHKAIALAREVVPAL